MVSYIGHGAHIYIPVLLYDKEELSEVTRARNCVALKYALSMGTHVTLRGPIALYRGILQSTL